jgi:hypothetical protein
VPALRAQKRANTCINGENGEGCPFHVPLGIVKKTIALAIKKQVELKNRLNLRVSGEKSLQKCSGCGCVLRLKVWMPVENLGMDENELQSYPGFCWMRTEQKVKKQ